MKKTIAILTALLGFSNLGNAQTEPIVYEGEEMWFLLLNKFEINDRWAVGNELHIRRHDFFDQQKQLIVRPWVDYQAADGFVASFGYSYLRSSGHGEFIDEITTNEHNIWEQITLSHSPWNNVEFSHRLRLEHRWSQTQPEPMDEDIPVVYLNRFRYRLTAKIDISEKWYTHIFDELWVNVNEGIQITNFDRNWIYAGLGYHFTDNFALEIAYLNQWDNIDVGYYNNQGLQATVVLDL